MKKLNNKKGFTIVELVIVIAVIGILAGVLIPTFASVVDKANASSAQQLAANALKSVLAEVAGTEDNFTNAMFYVLDKDKNVEYTVEYKDGELESAVKATETKAITVYAVSGETYYAKAAIGQGTTKAVADMPANVVVIPEA